MNACALEFRLSGIHVHSFLCPPTNKRPKNLSFKFVVGDEGGGDGGGDHNQHSKSMNSTSTQLIEFNKCNAKVLNAITLLCS